GYERQLVELRHRGKTVDLRMTRIHHAELSLEVRLADIAEKGSADGSLPRTGANQRNRSGREQIFQTIGRHRSRIRPGLTPCRFRRPFRNRTALYPGAFSA